MKRIIITTAASAAVVTATAFVFDVPVNLQPTSPGTTQNGHLHISGTAITGGVQGYSPTTTGIAYGGDFRSVSDQGRGVLGNASSTSGATYGGLFQAASTGGRGIAGIASATIGTTYGGFFTNFSVQGRGVYGEAKALTGVNYGVYGKAASPSGFGGFFEGNLGTTGIISGNGSGITNLTAANITGTIGDGSLSANVALRGAANTFTSGNFFVGGSTWVGPRTSHLGANEVFAVSSAAPSWGGMYMSTPADGLPYYAYDDISHRAYSFLETDGSLKFVAGLATPLTMTDAGFVGINNQTPTTAVDLTDENNNNSGSIHIRNGVTTSGFSTSRIGLVAEAAGGSSNIFTAGALFRAVDPSSGKYSIGVQGDGAGAGINWGVYGTATGGTTNYGGYFSGTLYADSATSGVKAFMIDHPLDPAHKFLTHSSVESDQRMDIYRGIVKTDANGRAAVSLPNWFTALNTDVQYQLTVVDTEESDAFVLAKVAKKFDGNKFIVRTSQPNVEVHWQVSGRRHDPTSEYMPLEVERRKVGAEDGRYLVPGAYGKDDSLGMAPRTIMTPEEQREAAKKKAPGIVRAPMGRR